MGLLGIEVTLSTRLFIESIWVFVDRNRLACLSWRYIGLPQGRLYIYTVYRTLDVGHLQQETYDLWGMETRQQAALWGGGGVRALPPGTPHGITQKLSSARTPTA